MKKGVPEQLKNQAVDLGFTYPPNGNGARTMLNNYYRGFFQNLTSEQIILLSKIDEADPPKSSVSPKILDRQFGQRVRKKRTGSRRG